MEILIDLRKIRYNISVIQEICGKAGLQIVWVSKGCHSHPEVIRVLAEMKAEIIGLLEKLIKTCFLRVVV